jgi:hypothetical protein
LYSVSVIPPELAPPAEVLAAAEALEVAAVLEVPEVLEEPALLQAAKAATSSTIAEPAPSLRLVVLWIVTFTPS